MPWRATRVPIRPVGRRRVHQRRWVWAVAMAFSAVALAGVFWGVGVGRWTERRVLPEVPITTSGPYKFIAEVNGAPVTYNPCRTIRYELNLTQAPPGAEGILGVAIQNVEQATGLKFEYVGISDRRPLDKAPRLHTLARTPPVIISWATPDEAPMLAGDVAGYAGSSYVLAERGAAHFATGQVALDSETFARMLQTPDGSAHARAIAMHELGHLVGLDHVGDEHELMYARNVGQLEFGPGDRAGLALLGQGRC